jgi:hypothetical protein
MHLEKQFDVKQARDAAVALIARDETLLQLFPETRTEIVESRDNRRTLRSHYRALGQQGTATFHFEYERNGDMRFEKVCDGRVWRELKGVVCFETRGKGTRVRIVMDGRTKALVPEFTIRGAMQEQIEQMAGALRRRLEQA